jgi:carbonic anhydrase/acetyltransferase-like protein (isoleucine patch superfamily)
MSERAGIWRLGERLLTTEGEDYYIAPGAQVIGSVRLGAAASLWFNCVLRGDDELIGVGRGSNVQDGSVLHADAGTPTLIGDNCTIGHMVMLHSCTLGEETLIGNGAIVLDRVRIGRRCLIAAGSLIPPDRQIPDDSVLMGSPAKIVRATTAEDLLMIRASAEHYRARIARYRAGLVAGR